VGEQYNVPFTNSVDELLKLPDIDAVSVVTFTGTHAEIAEKCLQAGTHVLVTKPMDASVERCEAMAALAREKGLLLACDFDLHFRGPLKELQKAARESHGAHAVFVIQMADVTAFSPNDDTHPAFGAALREAVQNGVQVHAFWCDVTPETMHIAGEVPVNL
jgi:predicted dehydrogenase